jgi:hypothetical protein
MKLRSAQEVACRVSVSNPSIIEGGDLVGLSNNWKASGSTKITSNKLKASPKRVSIFIPAFDY